MRLTWGEIKDLYQRATGDQPNAEQESWRHLNGAHEAIFARLRLPQDHVDSAVVTVPAGDDRVARPVDLYAIDYIVNKTTGRKLDPEPAGARGRARYFDTTGKPPVGEVTFYVAHGQEILLRGTADQDTTLQVSFKFHPADVGDANLDDHPLSPAQYDRAIALLATSYYFTFHPIYTPEGSPIPKAQFFEEAAERIFANYNHPTALENADRRQWVIVEGYDTNAR